MLRGARSLRVRRIGLTLADSRRNLTITFPAESRRDGRLREVLHADAGLAQIAGKSYIHKSERAPSPG
jgi:hypothetical protein